ncbi:hypothetical protein POTOM_044775 [Populus tomentosa]|uniref:Uncharacterized protein n=1 Tax=Populus tomentosa TaxID=118781 RepID=A0A8X7YK22_POPTO|nr:hypothetical protein POTOM_044775 [Populus tomentosa]
MLPTLGGAHGREDRRGGREQSGHEVYGKGRFELFNSDRKRKRVYADKYGDWEATNNRKVQNSKALAKKGHGSTIERKAELKEDAGMSKNAKFHAIQPTPSILSYVEDNVICVKKASNVWKNDFFTSFPV